MEKVSSSIVLVVLFITLNHPQNQVKEFETLKGMNYTIPTYWATIVVVALSSDHLQKVMGLDVDWNWTNHTLARIHVRDYANAVLLSYQTNTQDIQMWRYDFYPEYRSKATSDVKEVLKDKTRNLMGYQMRVLIRNSFPVSFVVNGELHGLIGTFTEITQEYLNASKILDIEVFNEKGSPLHRMFPKGDREQCKFYMNDLSLLNNSLNFAYPKLSGGLAIIIPHRTAPSLTVISCNSGTMLILIVSLLASLIWFLLPKFINRAALTVTQRSFFFTGRQVNSPVILHRYDDLFCSHNECWSYYFSTIPNRQNISSRIPFLLFFCNQRFPDRSDIYHVIETRVHPRNEIQRGLGEGRY